MVAHEWLFPWFAVLVGVVCCASGAAAAGRRLCSRQFPAMSAMITWLGIAIGALLFAFYAGQAAGVDSVAARGMLLGCLGGALLVFLAPPLTDDASSGGTNEDRLCVSPAAIGAATALVAAGRLWLTHGEPSGLSSLALGAVITIFALSGSGRGGSDSTLVSPQPTTVVMLYLVCLAESAQLGFARASLLKEVFWADLPLLMGAGVSLSVLLAAGTARLNRGCAAFSWIPLFTGGVITVVAVSRGVTQSWTLAELALLGAGVFALFRALQPRRVVTALTPGSASPSDELSGAIGALLLVAACLIAFGIYSGYGLGLLAIGAWWVLLASTPTNTLLPKNSGGSGVVALAGMAFACVLMIHRMLVLQSGAGIRVSGPGDTWDLLGIAAGALGPGALAGWLETQSGRSPRWLTVLEWLSALAGVVLLCGYLWGPRFMAGLLLGAALGQFLPALAVSARTRVDSLATSGVALGLTLFVSLPLLQHLETPTRQHRIILVFACAIIVIVRVLIESVSGRGAGRDRVGER